MAAKELNPQGRLHGMAVFLSASVPSPERADEYERIPEAPLRIEEAVVSVARAVFMEGGTLVFGGHPSISPLVARVVSHYYLPEPAEQIELPAEGQSRWRNPSVRIYQSKVWSEYQAEATKALSRHPLVEIVDVKAVAGEEIDPAITNRPQAPLSLEAMRRSMIEDTSPIAMVAIGGMKGVLDEAALFAELRPGRPVFALETTGGAAALLKKRLPVLSDSIHVPDEGALELVKKFWAGQDHERSNDERQAAESPREHFVPYAFVAQKIVEELIARAR